MEPGLSDNTRRSFLDPSDSLTDMTSSDRKRLVGGTHASYGSCLDNCCVKPQVHRHTGRTITVEPIAMLYSLIISCTIPLLQQFIIHEISLQHENYTEPQATGTGNEKSICEVNQSDPNYVMQQDIQARAARWMMLINASAIVPACVSTVLLSSYSDRAGRRRVLLVPMMGSCLSTTVALLVVGLRMPFQLYLIVTWLDGIFGSFATVIAVLFAYIADMTTAESRTRRIILVEVAMGLGGVIGNLSMGYLIKSLGFFYPLLIILGIYIIIVCYTFFLLPETRSKQPDATLFTLTHFWNMLKVYKEGGVCNQTWRLVMYTVMMGLSSAAETGTDGVKILYVLNSPLCWGSVTLGIFLAGSLVAQQGGSIAAAFGLWRWLGDMGLLLMGILSAVGYRLVLAGAYTTAQVFIAPLVGIFSPLSLSMIRVIASKLVPSHQQGVFFSGLSWVQLGSVLVGSFLCNLVYSATLQTMRGLVFLVVAGVYVIIAGIALSSLLCKTRKVECDSLVVEQPSAEAQDRVSSNSGVTMVT